MTKFLIDEDINQRVLRRIPAVAKGFDLLYPEAGGFKGQTDAFVRKMAIAERRVFVARDKDFFQSGQVPEDLRAQGVLWFRLRRFSQKSFGSVLERFCRFLTQTFPASPYDFRGRVFEVREDEVDIISDAGRMNHRLPG